MKLTRNVKLFFILFISLFSLTISAQSFEDLVNNMNSDPMSRVKKGPLPVEQAFVFDFSQQGGELTLRFTMPEGYHLYKDKFKFNSSNATFGDVEWPKAEVIDDPFFGPIAAYADVFEIVVPVIQSSDGSSLAIAYQGCSPTFCYPPRSKMVYLSEVGGGPSITNTSSEQSSVSYSSAVGGMDTLAQITGGTTMGGQADPVMDFGADYLRGECLADTDEVEEVKSESPSLAVEEKADEAPEKVSIEGPQQGSGDVPLYMFLLLGVGLALTPCVFPMYPILTSVVVGRDKKSPLRVFKLSMAYVQGMALVYSLVGVLVALMGLQFQQALQHPYVIGAVCILFLLLAGSLFGLYTIQLPARYQTAIHNANQKQVSGSAGGAFAMGALSGLVASPCTTAPLAGVLMYIAQTGNVGEGFISLYLLSVGMGIPLVIFALSGNRFLPKAGNWMNVVKNLMGFMLVGVAIYFAERIFSDVYITIMIAAAAFALSVYLLAMSHNSLAGKARLFGLSIGMAGVLVSTQFTALMMFNQVTGVSVGQPSMQAEKGLSFKRVSSLDEIEAEIAVAAEQGKPVMLDLYADWCRACHEFEAKTFSDSGVVNAMEDFHLIQIDLTELSEENAAIQDSLGVIGLPTILFYGPGEQELEGRRLFGFVEPEPFISHVNDVQSYAQCQREGEDGAYC